MVWDVLKIVLPPVIAGTGLWVHKALEDNKIEAYEWKRGLAQLIRTSIISLSAFYSLNFSSIGLDVDIFSTTAGAVFFEAILWLLRKYKK